MVDRLAGTPIHELSHVVVGTLCRIKITEVKLFRPDARSGVLGYVRYERPHLRWRETPQLIGTFLMGVAPLFGGSLVLLGALWLLAPRPELLWDQARAFADHAAGASPAILFQELQTLIHCSYRALFAEGFASFRPWLFLYVALAVGAHLAPSRADLQGGLLGLLVLLGLGLLADALALLAGAAPAQATAFLTRLTSPLVALLLLALTLSCVNLVLAGLLSAGCALFRGR